MTQAARMRDANIQQDRQFRMARITGGGGGVSARCRVRVWEVEYLDVSYTQSLGPSNLTPVVRSVTTGFAASDFTLNLAIGNIVSIVTMPNRQQWILQRYASCGSGSPSGAPEGCNRDYAPCNLESILYMSFELAAGGCVTAPIECNEDPNTPAWVGSAGALGEIAISPEFDTYTAEVEIAENAMSAASISCDPLIIVFDFEDFLLDPAYTGIVTIHDGSTGCGPE